MSPTPPPTPREAQSRFITLPPERFFWSVIEIAPLPARSRRDPRSLGYVFENALPLSLERVHAVYAPLDGDRVLACGLLIDELQAQVQEHPGMLALTPAEATEFLDVEPEVLASLNLCTGAFEPKPLRSARRRFALIASALWFAIVGLLLAGLERRIASQDQYADSLAQARQQVIQQALGSPAPPGAQPPELRFIAELRTLRQTRRQQPLADNASEVTDAIDSLASLAQLWPRQLNILTESLTITPTTMTLRAAVPNSGDVQHLADALAPIEGWQSQQPQVNAASDNKVNATLQWKRSPRPPHPQSPRPQPLFSNTTP